MALTKVRGSGIDADGQEIILDADTDTTITADTDDQIDFKTGGSDRVVIDSSGNVGIGTSSPTISNGRGLVIADATAARLKLCDTTTGEGASDGFQIGHSGALAFIFNHEDEPIQFGTNNTERMRIGSDGTVFMNTTSVIGPGIICIKQTESAKGCLGLQNTNSGGSFLRFANVANNAVIGTIANNGDTATSFNTTSDYRLKENVVTDWDATSRLKELKPSRFNWKTNKDKTVDGFIAHEVSSIVPAAITGETDAVDADGNPEYQGIDQSKLVPLLVKTIQELEARITALENA